MKTKKTTRKTTQKQWPPGKTLPKLATAAEEERLRRSHDFDEAMEAGGEEVTYEAQATRQARTHVYRVRLDDLEMSTLQALAKRRGVNASVVLRELVRAARPRPAKAGKVATKQAWAEASDPGRSTVSGFVRHRSRDVDRVDHGVRKTSSRSWGAPPRRLVLMERVWDRVAGTKEELKLEAAGRDGLVRVHFQQISGIRGILDLIGREKRERR